MRPVVERTDGRPVVSILFGALSGERKDDMTTYLLCVLAFVAGFVLRGIFAFDGTDARRCLTCRLGLDS